MEKIGGSANIKAVAVTGGISSGKSTVCGLLSKLGAHVIHADEIVHSLLQNDSNCISEIVRVFGKGILNSEEHIDRGALAEIAFSDAKKLAVLESIVHPKVIAKIKELFQMAKKSNKRALFVVEFPLLYEIGFEHWFDQVIYVKAPSYLAKKRFVEKGFSEEMYEKRNRRLLGEIIKNQQADIIIDNSGTEEDLQKQVMDFLSNY